LLLPKSPASSDSFLKSFGSFLSVISENIHQFFMRLPCARLMRQRLESDVQIPDMDKTVRETIASAGFPKFCYKSLTKPPEYLILIDLPTHRDHYASLADQIAAALKSEDIFVKRYFYENSPQICFEELTQERVYLSDLQTKFSDSRLIIFGNGEELLDPVSGQSEAWTEIFHIWQDKAILTPERPQRWGMREITLAEQFIVLPDTSEGLIELARHFDAESVPDLKKWHEEDAKPDIQEDKLDDITALKNYLGEDAFQWLCACAVYPELNWNLTLYLGMTDKNWLTEDNLLKLIRLPWFRKGVMPDTLRWELIMSLDKEKNKEIRKEIIRILEKSPPPKDSYAYNQYSLNLAMQKWMLGKKSRKEKQEILKKLRQADEKEVIQDYTFLRFLESVPNSPLALILPNALRKLLYKNGVPMFGFNTGVRMMITALFVVLVLMMIISDNKDAPTIKVKYSPETYKDYAYIEGAVSHKEGVKEIFINNEQILKSPVKQFLFNKIIHLREGQNFIMIHVTTISDKSTLKVLEINRKPLSYIRQPLKIGVEKFRRISNNKKYLTDGFEDIFISVINTNGRFIAKQITDNKIKFDYLLTGDIVEKNSSIEIKISLVDIVTSEIFVATDIYTENIGNDISEELARKLIANLNDELPLVEGIVIEIKDEKGIIIDMGSNKNIKKGMKILIYNEGKQPIIDPKTGLELGWDIELIGAEIIKVLGKISYASLDKGSDIKAIQRGYLVITR